MKNKKLIRPLSLLFLFFLLPFGAFAQTITVKGVVNDPNGEALMGVNVRELELPTERSRMFPENTSSKLMQIQT